MVLRKTILMAMASTALLVVAACSSGSTTPTAAPGAGTSAAPNTLPTTPAGGLPGSAKATDLLTADRAAAVLGGTPTLNPGSSAISASYTSDNGDSITMVVETMPGGVPQAALTAAMAGQGAGGMQPIGGLGDAAGKEVGAHEVTLAFVKGGSLVILGVVSTSQAGSDLDAKVEALARQIAGAL